MIDIAASHLSGQGMVVSFIMKSGSAEIAKPLAKIAADRVNIFV